MSLPDTLIELRRQIVVAKNRRDRCVELVALRRAEALIQATRQAKSERPECKPGKELGENEEQRDAAFLAYLAGESDTAEAYHDARADLEDVSIVLALHEAEIEGLYLGVRLRELDVPAIDFPVTARVPFGAQS